MTSRDYYGAGHYHDYHAAPAPPPPAPAQYPIYSPPQSMFTAPAPAPHVPNPAPMMDPHYAPAPQVIPVSPSSSIRSTSRPRGMGHNQEYVTVGRHEYLNPGGYTGLGRSNSERGRTVVEGRGRRHARNISASSGGGAYFGAEPRQKIYYEDDYSVYSGDSRGPSRSRSRHRPANYFTRSPSVASFESIDDYGVVSRRHHPSAQEEELARKLEQVQLQLAQVQQDSEKKKIEEEQAKLEKLRNEEIERKVREQMELERIREIQRAEDERRAMEEEKRRIEIAAHRFLEEKAAAEQAMKAAQEAEEAKVLNIINDTKRQYEAAAAGRKTYTRFSKAHLCKEALEERGVSYTEEADSFMVHRYVDKPEQKYLWDRTKAIRAYQKQIHDAAERAPLTRGPNGAWVKYVQVSGQPYPLAIPVTVTPTPGGGQSQRVEHSKISWMDLLRGGKR